jgi:hydrogenase expression/formation protein HypE
MDNMILLAHGEGGQKTHELIEKVLLKYFPSDYLAKLNDSALLPLEQNRSLVFTTDSHVVDPIFFPGGDIGRLAICGTVNDLAVCGAIPKYLSMGLILEEGFSLTEFELILKSIQAAVQEADVEIVTGDTKVVARGQADKIYINTSGVGFVSNEQRLDPSLIQDGDQIIVTGLIGQHGAAIMAERLGLNQEKTICSDVCPLTQVCQAALSHGGVRIMRDATRGGVATVLNEFARTTPFTYTLNETQLPLSDDVAQLCELIGAEPYYLANEGMAVLIAAPEKADEIVASLCTLTTGKNAAIVGEISPRQRTAVQLKTAFGTHRVLTMLSGGQFPRIC